MGDSMLEYRIKELEKQVKSFERNFQVLNEHSLYLGECVEKLKEALNLLISLSMPNEKPVELN
jgi:uncharacterized coiled-coil protein SlyX